MSGETLAEIAVGIYAGRELLEKWRVEGAGIVVSSSAAKDRIESMMDLPITLLGTKTKQYA